MISAILVYFGLVIMLPLAACIPKISIRNGGPYLPVPQIVIVVLFGVIIGSRYGVGTDYYSYFDQFRSAAMNTRADTEFPMEYLVTMLYKVLVTSSLEYYWFFIIMAGISMLFLLASYDRKTIFILPYIMLTFGFLQVHYAINTVRQFVAIMAFILAVRFIRSRNLSGYLAMMIIGYGFHHSILLLLPAFWLIHRDLFPWRVGILAAILLTTVFSGTLLNSVFDALLPVLQVVGYQWQIENYQFDDALVYNSGIGLILSWAFDLVAVYFLTELKEKYSEKGFIEFSNLFVFGLIITPITGSFINLQRFNLYFVGMRFIVFAYLIHYLWSKSQYNKSFSLPLVILIIAYFTAMVTKSILMGDSNCSPYIFIWEM